ncbi:NAD-dependent epimerase/dehydratase family protein [Acinetobacter stercoris]|uniref:RmlD substrate binding domain protein n=1 Tax=Acinetobacter stercoris TaxID=2126983 RepID=A0A2U3MV17_9GAMM|nr:NAD-dependent epimerase/dehydratase family protein [Acinetobacter stercoris]SPL69205.1 RmlD substrate binding domain protein [Acinetobacter stercoris]
MHILFIGYGKTSKRVAKQLFMLGHQITTISKTLKTDDFAQHLIQDVQNLDLDQVAPIDWVYILLSPSESTAKAYQQIYVDTVQPIVQALKKHPVQKIIVVSSTRVYGENAGEIINDDSAIQPNDEQGHLLLKMEQLWQAAYPDQNIIVRPTGIYGTSIVRMIKLAENTKCYPHIHWSNRIHIDDLADFLVYLIHVEHSEKSYIVSNNQPIPLHEMILWFQKWLVLPELIVENLNESGKQVFATNMLESGFVLKHKNWQETYKKMLEEL